MDENRMQPADTTTESAANAGGQGAAGDDLATIIQAGWDAAFADSWYLNATPSDNPEGVEVVNPAIVAGRDAWLQLQAENARLQTALTASQQAWDTSENQWVHMARLLEMPYEETAPWEMVARVASIIADEIAVRNGLASAEARADGLREALKPFANLWCDFKDVQRQTIYEEGGLSWGDWFARWFKRDMDDTTTGKAYQQAAKALEAPTTADGSGEAG